MNLFQGIVYENTDEWGRDSVQAYHRGPSPRDLSKTSHSVDVAGLPSKARRDIITFNGEHTSRFKVGFEIEKNRLHRGAVKEYPLFKGFEHDSSCGVTSGRQGFEAITNILPLLPAGKWRNKVFNMFVQAEKIIEDKYSPSNARCGGHMTLSVDGFTAYEVQQRIRKYSGIMYALYRRRLSNAYCNGDVFMDAENRVGASHYKYCITKVDGNLLEFRLPTRITGVKQLMRRYELAYEMLSYAFNTNGTYAKFIEKVRPIIVSMYDGDAEKAEQIIELSFHMQRAIDRKKINSEVREWFEPNGRRRFSEEYREYEY
jgi:hypothetical protein